MNQACGHAFGEDISSPLQLTTAITVLANKDCLYCSSVAKCMQPKVEMLLLGAHTPLLVYGNDRLAACFPQWGSLQLSQGLPGMLASENQVTKPPPAPWHGGYDNARPTIYGKNNILLVVKSSGVRVLMQTEMYHVVKYSTRPHTTTLHGTVPRQS